MSLEHSPARDGDTETAGIGRPIDEFNFWNALIDEREAAAHLGLVDRTLQGWRQQGGGPRFIRISSRTVRYRRIDLKEWADARVRTSTTDPGPQPDET